jgi:hypothetical protein
VTHILVLTPSLARVSLGYRDTFAGVTLECARREIKLSIADAIDPGLLPHARNVLLAQAVDSDATHAFWWDADVSFEPAALFDLLDRPEAMIVRPYPMRGTDFETLRDYLMDSCRGDGCPSVDELRDASLLWSSQIAYIDGRPQWSEDGKLIRVETCGFGWVLQKIGTLREFIRGCFFQPGTTDWHGRRFLSAFSHQRNEHGILMGEDISFCASWRPFAPIWAAPEARIQNGGRIGRFADYLANHGVDRPVGREMPDLFRWSGTHPHKGETS